LRSRNGCSIKTPFSKQSQRESNRCVMNRARLNLLFSKGIHVVYTFIMGYSINMECFVTTFSLKDKINWPGCIQQY